VNEKIMNYAVLILMFVVMALTWINHKNKTIEYEERIKVKL